LYHLLTGITSDAVPAAWFRAAAAGTAEAGLGAETTKRAMSPKKPAYRIERIRYLAYEYDSSSVNPKGGVSFRKREPISLKFMNL